jgi:ribosomal protein S18 acetylase RimI-like enzyme
MSLATRPAREDDAGSVIALWERCGLTRAWNDPQADFARALDGPASAVLLSEEAGLTIATIMVGFDGHRGWLYYLAVEPRRQGQGFGRFMLEAACDWLRERGCPKVELMVRDGNPAAGLYEHLGWELQAVRTYARRLDDHGAG